MLAKDKSFTNHNMEYFNHIRQDYFRLRRLP
jgi:hypothetical protein